MALYPLVDERIIHNNRKADMEAYTFHFLGYSIEAHYAAET